MNRETRKIKAIETLEYFKRGYYLNGTDNIICKSKFIAEFITEDNLKAINIENRDLKPKYEIINESVVDSIFRFKGSCGVLNFASAKNAGGGFLNGSLAQEEALAISSDLYISQLQVPQYYEINRNNKSLLYTHNMIYSKDIMFIRDSQLNLVEEPITTNILTSPAVNAGAYYRNERGVKEKILEVMEQRIKYLLKLFASKGDKRIILGAYGCGVFQNDPNDVAGIFHRLLKEECLEGNFESIVFSIYGRNGEQYNIFRNVFSI